MRGQALTEGQIRGRLASVHESFQAHGKDFPVSELIELIEKRLSLGRPFLGEMFEHFEDRDYETMLNILKHDLASHEEGLKKRAAEQAESKKSASKSKSKKKSKPKADLKDVEVDVSDDVDVMDV